MSDAPACPECGTEVQPSWNWCEACGFDPEGLRAQAEAEAAAAETAKGGSKRGRKNRDKQAAAAVAPVVSGGGKTDVATKTRKPAKVGKGAKSAIPAPDIVEPVPVVSFSPLPPLPTPKAARPEDDPSNFTAGEVVGALPYADHNDPYTEEPEFKSNFDLRSQIAEYREEYAEIIRLASFVIVSIVILSLFIVIVNIARDRADEASVDNGATNSADPWPVYTSPDGGFSVRLPATPQTKEVSVTLLDKAVTLHQATIPNGNETITVTFTNFPVSLASGAPTVDLAQLANDRAAIVRGTVAASIQGTADGRRSIDYEIDGAQGKMLGRAMISTNGKRFYFVEVVGLAPTKATLDRVNASLKIT